MEDEFDILIGILEKLQKNGRIELSKIRFNDITEDLVFTFIEYMRSCCLIRLCPMYHSFTVYSLSKPGYNLMRQREKQVLFVTKFLGKYRDYETMFGKTRNDFGK